MAYCHVFLLTSLLQDQANKSVFPADVEAGTCLPQAAATVHQCIRRNTALMLPKVSPLSL